MVPNFKERSVLEDDYFSCKVAKPTRDDVYTDEDYEFMSLVPDPIEPKFFEYTSKVQRERNRR
jgi:hypothetical protein